MQESEFKEKLVREIRHEGGYARRIEDQFSVGMPDMVVIPKGCPVIWMEAKIVAGQILKPRPRQLIELTRLYRPPHSITALIGWKAGYAYLAPPEDNVPLKACMKQQLNETYGDFFRRFLKEEVHG